MVAKDKAPRNGRPAYLHFPILEKSSEKGFRVERPSSSEPRDTTDLSFVLIHLGKRL